MVRKEIKNFELIVSGEKYSCLTPCSVRSVLSANGVKAENLGDEVRFEANIYVDEVSLAMKNFYIRLRGINSPSTVYIGEEKIASLDGVTPIYHVNLAGRLEKGDNRLSVRFSSADVDLAYAGISEGFELLRFSSAIISDVALSQQHEEGVVTLGINLDIIGNPSSVRAVATLVSSTGQIYYAGLTGGRGSVVVRDPLYWWPNGMGVQNLYRLTINLYGETDIDDSLEMRVGLRTVESVDGHTIFVGGSEMIPMGAVYIADRDPDFASANSRVESLITAAAASGYNCLVVPENSPVPTDRFYDLCDTYGIIVIEEKSVIDGATIDSLRHRIHHPSLCLIDLLKSENIKIYESRMKDALPALKYVVVDSFLKYISSHSLPSMKSIRAIVPESERNLFSKAIEDMSEKGAIKDMLISVADKYPYPKNLATFGYASALASAYKVGDEIKKSRLSRGKTGRGVFNRIGDTSLIISSSAIDYRGRWKPLQYYCSRFFAPISLYAECKDGVVKFFASNIRRHDFIGTLEFRIADASNYTIFKSSFNVELASMTEGEIHTADLSEVVGGHERDYYLEFYLKEGAGPIAKSTLLFVPEKHFNFKKPFIKTEISGSEKKFSITISATNFVKDLEICFDGIDAVFSDNYIDLTGEAPIKVEFTITGTPQTAYHLNEKLELHSVWDLK